MRSILKHSILFILLLVFVAGGTSSYAQLSSGQTAPMFSSKDTYGRPHDLSKMAKRQMIVLYFFDAESKPSQKGLVTLDQLIKEYQGVGLVVWGITKSSKNDVSNFVMKRNPEFPVIIDRSGISDAYNAAFILPTICIIGPNLKVLDYFQGGGKTSEVMLARLAERQLQRNQTVLAKAIGEKLEAEDPENIKAKTIKGYAALKEGKLNEAKEEFLTVSKKKGQGEVLGKEGLVAVYAKKGETEKALSLAREVEKKAPERPYVHVIKGELFYSQDKKQAAEEEWVKATQKKEAEPYQEALPYNQLGRLQASIGNYEKARNLYDQAVDINPYYIEAMSNKGVTHEKEGHYDKAVQSYQEALSMDKNDVFSSVLAKKAEEMMSLQGDAAKKERIDKLVKELAERFRSKKQVLFKSEDSWTSRPMILSFVDFMEKGRLTERDGVSTVLSSQLSDQLNASGRVKVVERVILEKLLEELNLGSSELADPETALKLGRVLAAKVIGTGSLFFLPDKTLFSLRLIDTETSAIPKVFTKQFGSLSDINRDVNWLNREILKTIVKKYPLRGFVVQVMDDQIMINLGSNQGVVMGTKFDVVEEQKPIKYKGKLLKTAPKAFAEIEITQVEPDLSYAQILTQDRAIERDDKVKEKLGDFKPFAAVEIIKVGPDLSYAQILQQKRAIESSDRVKENLDQYAYLGVGND